VKKVSCLNTDRVNLGVDLQIQVELATSRVEEDEISYPEVCFSQTTSKLIRSFICAHQIERTGTGLLSWIV
jgi:hypothetical protein